MEPAIARIVREARLRQGWSQAELSRQLGVKQRQISRWETGPDPPSRDEVDALSQVLEFSPEELEEIEKELHELANVTSQGSIDGVIDVSGSKPSATADIAPEAKLDTPEPNTDRVGIEKQHSDARDQEFGATRAGSSSTSSYLDDLERVGKLYKKGSLTDEEFTAAKRQILGI